MKNLIVLFILFVSWSNYGLAQIVLSSSRVVNQGSLGICASASTAVILETQGDGEASFIDLAISQSFAKGSLFDLQGSDVVTLLYGVRENGFCPRSESHYEKLNNPKDILGELHAKLMKLLQWSKNFNPEEKLLQLELREEIREQMEQFKSPIWARDILKSSAFLKHLYQGTKSLTGPVREEALEWLDSYVDYNFNMALEENQTATTIIKEIKDNLYTGDAWEGWLKQNVIGSVHAKNFLVGDLAPTQKKIILQEVAAFSQTLTKQGIGFPDTFNGKLKDIRPDLIKWIYTTSQFITDYKLNATQAKALEDLLINSVANFSSMIEFRENVWANLRKFFRVGCELNSSKRIPVSMTSSKTIKITDRIKRHQSWPVVFEQLQTEIQDQIQKGLPIGLSYDFEHTLKIKTLPALTLTTTPKGFLHASVITGMRELQVGKIEYLIHNSYGKDCADYYDPSKCHEGKIWVSPERLIPYTETLQFFEL